ncbi:MAG TPA: hypothetical protein VKO83_01790 [Steroidobacteraceae bacterium]|nr:hypothetical protein [Steroidobacteraceae bacterium]
MRSSFSRRRVLATLGATPVASVLAESADAAAAAQQCQEGGADAVKTEPVFSALLNVNLATPADASVGSAVIQGGEAQGEIAGEVQPGSLAWTRDPVRGVLRLEVRFDLQARAGARIHVADIATVVNPSAAFWEAPFPTTPELTVIDGSPAACRQAVYLGRMDARQLHAGQLRLTVHRVL